MPPQCEAIRWDAEGRGLLCWAEGLDGGLWYWPRADSRAVRRLHHAGVSDIAPLQGGYVLAVVPIPCDARRRGHLHLLHTDGTFSKRITGTPSFDRICDVSPDYRRVLLARSPCDDRGELRPDATLWLLEVRQEK